MASVTRQIAKIDITVNKRDQSEYLQEMRKLLSQFSSFESRRRIAESASQLVIDSARRMAQSSFKNQEKHYTYNTPKLMRRIKAPAGQGVVTGEYAPGNLMRSIIDIAKRRSIYKKKTYKVIIGPYYRGRGPLGGKARQVFNTMSKIDGYYAHMVYGSAKAFQSRIMIPALKQVQSQVLAEMRKESERILKGEAQKTKYVKASKSGIL
jgi:hypothetical protein